MPRESDIPPRIRSGRKISQPRRFPSFCHRPPHLLRTVRRPCFLKARFCLRFVLFFMSSENLQINPRTPLSAHSTPVEGRFSTRKKGTAATTCGQHANEYLIYVYLCKSSPQIRAEASTRMSARRLIRLLFNSKRGNYPYFLPLTISYILHVRP